MLRNSCVLLGAFVCLCVAGGASSSYVNPFQPFESDQEKWAETSDNYEELQQYHHMGDTEIQEDKPAGTFNDDGPSCSLEGIPVPPVENPVNKTAGDSEKPELKPEVEEPTDAKEEKMDDDEKNLKAAPVKEEPQLKPAAEIEEPQLKSAPVNPRKPPSGTTEGLYAQKNKAESGTTLLPMDFGRYYEEGTNIHHLERRGPSLSATKSARFSLPGKILWQKPNINIKENIKDGCSWLVAFRRRTPAYSWVSVDRGLVQVRRMPGNGDCLFEAIHHQLGIVRPEVPAPTVDTLRRSVQIFLKRERKKDETVYLNILNTASADPYIRSDAMETLRERRKLDRRRSASRASRDSVSRATRDSAPSSPTLNDETATPYSKRTASGSTLEHGIKRTASVGSASVPASRRAASTSPALAHSSSSDASVDAKKRTASGSALEYGIKRTASVGAASVHASRRAASTSPALDRSSSSDASVEAKSERLESFRRDGEESFRREEVESSDDEPFEEQEINDMLIEKFIDQVGMRSVWGGTESIYALSQMLQISIHLYNENGPDFLFDGFPNEIRICYRGSPGGRNHYDSVVAAHFKATRLPVMLYISPCVYLEYKILYYNFVTKRQRFFRLFRKQCDRCAKQYERCAKQYDRCAKQCAACAKRCQDFVKECATEEELLKESASTTNRERS